MRYRNAYASSPWTLPSHASLFTGLNVEQHGVGIAKSTLLAEGFVTLAERMRAAGYQTAAIIENALVSDSYRLLQGFDYRRVSERKEG